MKFGIYANNYNAFGTPSAVESIAHKAEDLKWDGIFLADNIDHDGWLNNTVDPWIMLASIAATTTNIKLGTWITPVARRLPWQLARNVATLDQISNGRVILGTGLGFPAAEYENYGSPYDLKELGNKYDEGLQIIDMLWKDGPVSFKGTYYTLDNANLQPKPVQKPRVPIVTAAKWPNKKPIRRGARWDGIMPVSKDWPQPLPNEEIKEMIKYYHSHREAADSGEIVLAMLTDQPLEEFISFCEEVGVTWLLYIVDTSIGGLDANLQKIEEVTEIISPFRAG